MKVTTCCKKCLEREKYGSTVIWKCINARCECHTQQVNMPPQNTWYEEEMNMLASYLADEDIYVINMGQTATSIELMAPFIKAHDRRMLERVEKEIEEEQDRQLKLIDGTYEHAVNEYALGVLIRVKKNIINTLKKELQ